MSETRRAKVQTDKTEFIVWPIDHPDLNPVTLTAHTGAAHVQAYLTPDQARELGRALIAEAAAADIEKAEKAEQRQEVSRVAS